MYDWRRIIVSVPHCADVRYWTCPLVFVLAEFYRMLPVRQVLLEGILGADLVCFNHFDYVRHFLNSCTR